MLNPKLAFAALYLTVAALAQTGPVLFDDVKLSYQRAGETKFREDDGLLVLDSGQKVMLVLRENRPLFILRYDNITGMSFEEKRDRRLTVRFGGQGSPSGMVHMELPGKWRDILDNIRAQSGKQIETVISK